MELAVFNTKGEDTGRKVVLQDSIFAIEPNDHAIYLDVKQFLANQRQGTHKTKERSELSGSRRKLIRQKGSGGARRGDIKSPILVGGARVFGPRPRSYSFKLNKKVKDLARRSALTHKALKNEIVILENFDLVEPKTKSFVDVLKALKIGDRKATLFLATVSDNIAMAARNVATARLIRADQLSTYAVLDNHHMVITEDALEAINAHFNEKSK